MPDIETDSSEESVPFYPDHVGKEAKVVIGFTGLVLLIGLAGIFFSVGLGEPADPLNTPAHVKRGYYMADYVAMVTAHLNQVYLAMASQVGRDEEHWLFGSSVLVSPYGWPLVEPAGDDEPAVLHAQVDFTLGRRLRGWSNMDHFDRDRRTDVYGQLLGYIED